MHLQGLTDEQLSGLMAQVEQLRIADDLPFAAAGSSQRSASSAATPSRRPQRSNARSAARSVARSVRQPAVSYKESSTDEDEACPLSMISGSVYCHTRSCRASMRVTMSDSCTVDPFLQPMQDCLLTLEQMF